MQKDDIFIKGYKGLPIPKMPTYYPVPGLNRKILIPNWNRKVTTHAWDRRNRSNR